MPKTGGTPLMYTIRCPGAAKFLLNWPTTDAIYHSIWSVLPGHCSLDYYRLFCPTIIPSDSLKAGETNLIQRWREIEEMLVERGAVDTGITAFE
jgi:hypothetical protein